MSRIAKKVFYEGRVQGVGFRYTTRHLASGFEVTGTVKNLPDGRVELCVGGDKGEVEDFLRALRESTLAGHISREYAEDLSPETRWKGFTIVHA
ncbi:MAG TPA: acylphosphatase [Chthoniobacterales bacterium]